MASRLNLTKKNLLVTIHVVSVMSWFGATVSLLLLLLSLNKTGNGEHLLYTLSNMDVIDKTLVRFPAIAALVSGIVLSISTPWRLFKHYSIIVKLFLTILIILMGILVINGWSSLLEKTVDHYGFASLQRVAFQTTRLYLILAATFNITAMIIMTFITYVRPWGKRQKYRSSS